MTQLIGVFDLFRIGLGPSSSHTVGPMRAARAFAHGAAPLAGRAARVVVTLYGSLAWTGKGHGTDVAVLAGLAGMEPATADPDVVHGLPARVRETGTLELAGLGAIAFDLDRDLLFDRLTPTPDHPNTLDLRLEDAAGAVLRAERWFSVGGGFVVRAGDAPEAGDVIRQLPFPYRNASDILAHCAQHGMSIAELQFANECAVHSAEAVRAHIAEVAAAMESCIERGLGNEGELPGGLKVRRRARTLAARIEDKRRRNIGAATEAMDHASLWAIAVNEENAAGGRVVTAPTNGAAGVVPAVLRYWHRYHADASPEGTETFLLAAATIGALAKTNASISGAEVGCQGEVGVACAMAAAGLTSVLGGTPAQVENAAEIGLEHHLGMTCDPIGGLVQIPCIERNAMGAVKAINAASLALSGDGTHRVSLDEAIATMRQTGLDMHDKYKETSQGGLAVHVTEC
ncbi:L-serine ammonia-lyase [Limobrevibacterium gyesilva]|uniref:L-serine dehydratase n=1 Tax=Limobrevibacterium gyesilva TaxID=2991712 RepID=A0AA41YTA6_9PROT|nr:L-serine ammonia-lyase [Limobrevibacterium gyesilva]MCW3475062.1 L-serine ammonia-lyase [Limobrevibacterium gyesilva]